jgi:hypothetical protein
MYRRYSAYVVSAVFIVLFLAGVCVAFDWLKYYTLRPLCLDTITQSEKILESISGEQHNNKMHMSSGQRFLTWLACLAAAM